jgi:archaeal type IV pilus assembly protein PilA
MGSPFYHYHQSQKGGIKEKMNTIRKIKHDVKALSPVVASIILIAVTVAVSIAVAAWMGALTVGFMNSNSATVTNMVFLGTSNNADNSIVITLSNTGTKAITIQSVKLNSQAFTGTTVGSGSNLTIAAGETGKTITLDNTVSIWTTGNAYKVDLYDTSGQVVASYQQTPIQ